ncbi:MAG TPA: hypothetical protein VE172_22010 [Stackebrandtia sp.]|jgi:hypothetical protein|uniref:hypothetical protein n=1 Tax=Stackebrandtia sp. TaxID=2023065 RepID=UPI002D743704|nr:hypothetical protein [Stackebrandtia sp.]HZE41485.1 hypothetical protein [Stackebrandtia sp.]
MPARVGTTVGRLNRSGRGFKIAGAIIAVFVLFIMPYMALTNDESGNRTTWDVIWYVVLGYVCGLPLFAGVPWMVGFTQSRQANEQLVLNGTQLTVVGLIRSRPNVFDLSRARVRVELIGGRRTDSMTAELAQGKRIAVERREAQIGRGPLAGAGRRLPQSYFVPFHPVLVFYREADDFAIPVELCDVASRAMRDPRETMAIAEAMRFNADPVVQHTAGQLRTIARWRQLPHITAARADAVPATPADYPYDAPPIPTPVQGGEPAPEIQFEAPPVP